MSILEFKKKIKDSFKKDRSDFNSIISKDMSAIGIDLGTTNSVVSILYSGENQPITLSYDGSNLIPSLIYYNPKNSEVLVGAKVNKFLELEPAEVIKSAKKSMGKNSSVFYSNGKYFSAEDSATHILNYIASHPILLKEKEKFGGIWAVITVPAHFDDAARTATILAAEKAGIFVLRIINEPTAAALAYSMISGIDKLPSENLAVFDFGGGTFDVSIVERNELTFNVLSSEGDVNLGGDDVDEALTDLFLKKIHPPFVGRRITKESEIYRKISKLAENAKKVLQIELIAQIQDNDLDGKGSSLNIELDRNEFEEIVYPILQKTVFLTESSIKAAKKSPKNISRILLVGGSTRLNLVRKMLNDYFPCQVDARLEPDLAVSWGASLQSAIILGIKVETILVDVCNYSLGVGVVESTEAAQENFKSVAKKFGINYPILEEELNNKLGDRINEFNQEIQNLLRVAPILYRNSPLPARKSEFFNTVYHNQSAVHVVVVQGEGKTVGENRLIGSFMFKLEQPCPKGTRCEIQLTYDVNGMVHVFAKQLGTENEAKAHFDSRTGEVLGWSKLNEVLKQNIENMEEEGVLHSEEENPYKNVTSIHNKDEPLLKENLNKVISIKFGAGNLENVQSADLENIKIVNAIVMRAKRTLSKLSKDSPEYNHILNLTEQYSALLELAKDGENNDEQIEYIENELMICLEGK